MEQDLSYREILPLNASEEKKKAALIDAIEGLRGSSCFRVH